MKILAFLFPFLIAATLEAQTRPTFTYDLGVSSGRTNDKSYTEINLGLNWYLSEYLIWRNSIFNRFGTGIENTTGLDTSARFAYNTSRDPGEFGIGVFAGPGLRISKKEFTGVFGEAGITLRGPGLALGVVGKSIHYPSASGDDSKNETVVSIVVGASGAL